MPRRKSTSSLGSFDVLSFDSAPSDYRNEGGDHYSAAFEEEYNLFERSETFSQLENENGLGRRVVQETRAFLSLVAQNGAEPGRRFDKHDRRPGTQIYSPPHRAPGRVVISPFLITDTEGAGSPGQSSHVTVIHNNISVAASAASHAQVGVFNGPEWKRPNKRASTIDRRFGKSNKGALKQLQIKLKQPSATKNSGQFKRKQPSTLAAFVAPTIPIGVRSLGKILQHWCVGDPSRNLRIPLCQFTEAQRNGNDASGKSNKELYSKRKSVALATLLALDRARREGVSFCESIGCRSFPQSMNLESWRKVCSEYLKLAPVTRRFSEAEIIELSDRVYKKEYLSLLP